MLDGATLQCSASVACTKRITRQKFKGGTPITPSAVCEILIPKWRVCSRRGDWDASGAEVRLAFSAKHNASSSHSREHWSNPPH